MTSRSSSRWPDGTRETVIGGDVSVRGLFGYLD